MQPVQITIRDLPTSPALEDHIRKKAQKLEQFYQRINNCRIVVTVPQKHKHKGKLFCIRIDLTVPGKELVVNRHQDEDIYIAIRDAFKALERKLENFARKNRGEVKTHNLTSLGTIQRIFPSEGFGFIKGIEGNEYYFSDVNLIYPSFDLLKVGDRVEFVSIVMADGLQANRITKLKNNNPSEGL